MEFPSPEADELQTLEEMRESYAQFANMDLEGVIERFVEREENDEI